MEGVTVSRKAGGGEFMRGLLERFNAGADTSSFHTSAFKHTFEGIKARFGELK
jgi:hypothetical protein